MIEEMRELTRCSSGPMMVVALQMAVVAVTMAVTLVVMVEDVK